MARNHDGDTALCLAGRIASKDSAENLITELKIDIHENGHLGYNCIFAAILRDKIDNVIYLNSIDPMLIEAKSELRHAVTENITSLQNTSDSVRSESRPLELKPGLNRTIGDDNNSSGIANDSIIGNLVANSRKFSYLRFRAPFCHAFLMTHEKIERAAVNQLNAVIQVLPLSSRNNIAQTFQHMKKMRAWK